MENNELKRVIPEQVGLSSKKMLEMLTKLEKCGTEPHGLIISRNGCVALECWWLPYTKDTIHICHSFGKSYVATAVGAACTQGLLSVEDRIVDIFAKEIKLYGIQVSENLSELKVKHVLSMTNGMSKQPDNGADLVRSYLSTPVDKKPGTEFLYNTTGSCMLGEIVRKVTGMSLLEYLKKQVFDDIGIDMEHLKWMTFKNGLHAAPGVASNTENNLRLGMLYLQNGTWNGKKIIDKDWIFDATHKQIDNETGGYGYQLWMHTAPDSFRFTGGHGQDCIISRPQNLVYAINQAASEPHDWNEAAEIFNRYLLKDSLPDCLPEDPEGYEALKNYIRTRKLPDNASEPTRAFADGWDGTYRLSGGNFNIQPELRPDGKKNVYTDFYDTENINVQKMKIIRKDGWFEIILDDTIFLHARLDGCLKPHETKTAMPAYTWECSTVVFEHNTMIVDTWFYQICFKTRIWINRKNGFLHIKVRKDRLHDDMPYIWYEADMKKE
jgi:hypothetical protein